MTVRFAPRPAPTLAGQFVRTSTDYYVRGRRASSGRLYAHRISTGALSISDDNGVTWTDQDANTFTLFGSPAYQFEFDATHMWVLVTGGCRLFRAPIDEFATWDEMTPPAMPGTAIGRAGVLCVTASGAVLLGNYNTVSPGHAYVFRWNGTAWSTVLDAEAARHVHAVQQAPNGHIFVSLGDAGTADSGLWRSTDDGVTWTHVAPGNYGIAMTFPPTVSGVSPRVLLESDGPITSVLYQWVIGSAGITSLVEASRVDDGGASWAGSGRGITITANGDLWWMSDGEGGAIGTRYGIWLAQGPRHKDPILLEELSAPSDGGIGYVAGPYLHYLNWRMTVPSFA